MVMEAQSPITELLAKHPVLLAKVVNDLQLALIHPPGNGDQQKAEWVENSLGFQSPLSRVRSYGGTIADSYRSSFRTHTGFRTRKGGMVWREHYGIRFLRGLFALFFPTNLTMCPCNHYLC